MLMRISIKKMDHLGRGIGYNEGKVIFIPKAIPGDVVDDIITIGIKEYKAKNNKVTSFESNILSTYQGGSKGMKNKMGQ